MATEPQTAAGQRPVEALAAKLRRRYVPCLCLLDCNLYRTTILMLATARQVVGSRETALETVLVLRQVVTKARFQNINQLVEIIRSVGQKLIEAQPKGAPLQTSFLCRGRRILKLPQSIQLGILFASYFITFGKSTTMRPRAKRRHPRTRSPSRTLCCRVSRADKLRRKRQNRRSC